MLERLEDYMEADEAEQVIKVAIEWGRYVEHYEYYFHTRGLALAREIMS